MAEGNPANVVTFRGHRAQVYTVVWNADGRRLASGSADRTIRLWNLSRADDNRYSAELRGHNGSVHQVVWDPAQPDRLASVSTDKNLMLWDTRVGQSTMTIPTQKENLALSWCPRGQTVATITQDYKCYFFDLKANQVLPNANLEDDVNDVRWNARGDLLFVATGRGTVNIYTYPELECIHTLHAHTSSCFALDLDPTGQYLGVGSADALVSLWSLIDLACVRTFNKHDSPVHHVSFSMDGRYLASAAEDKKIDISDVETEETVHTVPSSTNVRSLAWHPSKPYLAFTGEEGLGYGARGVVKLFKMES
ncbi:hypothetical protein IWQ61_000858 [Dispira simplex]|nr:hypothetical protein IWQ61_000858 [Dispira simplex]